MKTILVANRGEIAIRIIHAAAELGWQSVAIATPDDQSSLHVAKADKVITLPQNGVSGYLDIGAILMAAKEAHCDAVHPGYGFLSENAEFARACSETDLIFIGPRPETLDLFGDKSQARALAQECGVPVLEGTSNATSLSEAEAFLESLGPNGAIMVKALSGGGGRGMRAVTNSSELAEAFERCQSEAQKAFGNGDVYVERLIRRARHLEVQIVGDGNGKVVNLGERECTVQRRNQKLIEVAPSPTLSSELRARLIDYAEKLAKKTNYLSLGTIEFLLDCDARDADQQIVFIEANPRLQVEHTVTEQVFGCDLVQLQMLLALDPGQAEKTLTSLTSKDPVGYAIQVRVNAERPGPNGTTYPASGTLSRFDLPFGPGVRVDTCGYTGYQVNPSFDPLLAKVIGHSQSGQFSDAIRRTYRALCETNITGVETNLSLLQAILQHPDFQSGTVTTTFLKDKADPLSNSSETNHAKRYVTEADGRDPLAVFSGQSGSSFAQAVKAPDGSTPVPAPLQGTVVTLSVSAGDTVPAGAQLAVLEAMKMEHVIPAPVSGRISALAVEVSATVVEGQPLLFIEEEEVPDAEIETTTALDLTASRADLDEVNERHHAGYDDARPQAVERRRKTNQRTARENIEDLCDNGSYVEYGPIVIAAQRRRRQLDDLIANTPADGMLTGIGRVNGHLFPDDRAQCVVMSYDYTVLAGTQGSKNHQKKDRMFELAARLKRPVILFTEGGGGRPGDTDTSGVAGLDCLAFKLYGELSGLVPLVAINSGRCFAGNAALLGCSDVVIATENSNIGMGGPAMIEGGGLGVFRPDDVGPMRDQVSNGVVDIPVKDEIEAVATAKKYISYFQGAVPSWTAADQRLLRHLIPENRLRVYDVRSVIEALADEGSVLEIRRAFGVGMVTAFIRIEGRPIGLIANNPMHLAGAIDADGADKAARFMQLCDAHDIPLLMLCDTPGIMVGPEVEKTALVRHASRLFVTGANLSVPVFTVVLRKGYGLGAQAMAGGSFRAPVWTIGWPTSEFGGMGLEGAVKLGYRKELEAIEDPQERQELFEQMVARMYEHGKGTNMASHFEIDDVIDPANTRHWIVTGLDSSPPPEPRTGKKRPCVDTW